MRCFTIALTQIVLASVASAHVMMDGPANGTTFMVGDTVTIDWHVHIAHNTLNWDLEYSTVSSSGPWLPVATDLPAGDISDGAPHSFDWVLPAAAVGDPVFLRVRQDNAGQDYYSQRDIVVTGFTPPSFRRGDCNDNGSYEIADAITLLVALFSPSAPSLACDRACDTNGDGSLELADALASLDHLFGSGSPPAAPYPACGADPATSSLSCASPSCP